MVKQVSKLDTLSPLKTLTRGYCIAEQKDGMIKSVNDIKKEDEINLRFVDGNVKARVI